MFFQRSIKTIALVVTLCLIANVTYSQNIQTKKYDKEYNPYFKFDKFQRGTKSNIIAKRLDELESIDKDKWTTSDSFEFAEISLQTGNIDLSQYYLELLLSKKKSLKKTTSLYFLTTYLTQDFETGNKILERSFSESKPFTIDYFIKCIFLANESLIANDIKPKLVFGIYNKSIDSIQKKSDNYTTDIIQPLKNAKHALEFYVMYIHEDDKVIATCFNEIGLVLEDKVSLNQAYIAYSIARIYNKKDKNILANVKRIKAKHVKNNFNTPNFRKYFPRIEYWRFDYEILKEKIISEKNDTIPKHTPILSIPEKKSDSIFPIDAFVPVGFLVIIILIILFTRTKKR